MDFKTFTTTVLGAVEKLTDVTAAPLDGSTVKYQLTIPGIDYHAIVDMDNYFDDTKNRQPIEDTVTSIAKSVNELKENADVIADMDDYEKAKSHLIPKLVPLSQAEDVPYVPKLGVAAKVIFIIKAEGDEIVSFDVHAENIHKWKKTIDEVLTDAIANAKVNLPATIESIEDVLGLGADPGQPSFYVLSNAKRHFGAAELLDDELLKDFHDRIGEDFHVIPSSIHEALLIPDSIRIPAAELRDMCIDVNTSVVKPDDVLDDHIYAYKNGKLTVADTEKEEKKAKETAKTDAGYSASSWGSQNYGRSAQILTTVM